MTRDEEARLAAFEAGLATLAECTRDGLDVRLAALVAQAVANQAYVDRMSAEEVDDEG